ncbi:hypothetical protein BASA83_003881 [Batrachochytrium salamandrivorans]|nr:hypothetical protein BASA83_003881 [Batrachochytrium salamandrivorans]
MLSSLITTFLCAVAIGSVSGAFLAFDPDPISFEDIEAPNSFSVQLKSKPTEEVIVYFEHPFLPISDCVIVFDPNNWNAPRPMTVIPAPLFVGSSNPPRQLKSLSGLLAKSVTVGSLSAELPSVDTFKVIQRNIGASLCSIKNQKVETFDEIPFSFNKLGWYQLLSTRDIGVQVFVGECTAELSCIKKVLARYGSFVMSLDVSGPVKNISEYSVTKVTQNDNGLRYTPGAKAGATKLIFHMDRSFISRPRYPSRNNRLVGPDAARNYLQTPKKPPPKPVIPVLTTTTAATATASTLSPTITYVLSSSTITTSPSTTSTTSPPPPAPPQLDVVGEI